MDVPAFAQKPLWSLSEVEWEQLCDGCARCCLHKLEDEETGDIAYTRIACRLLDLHDCRCKDYPNRQTQVPGCVSLRTHPEAFGWLPSTCAYRLRAEGKPLPDWHPARSGRSDSVHRAGVSVRHFALSEAEGLDPEDHLLDDGPTN